MAAKLGYKTFEYICDLQIIAARERTDEAITALDTEQGRHSWPWCLTQEQIDDWNALYARLDPPSQEQ